MKWRIYYKMHRDLYNEYKNITNELNTPLACWEIIILAIITALLTIGTGCSALGFNMLGVVLMSLSVLLIIIIAIVLSRKKNQIVINHNHKDKEIQKHQKLRKLLNEYGIDYRNRDEMLCLITYYGKRKEQFKVYEQIKLSAKNVVSFVILPMLICVITKSIEKANLQEAIGISLLCVVFSAIGLLFFNAIGYIISPLVNKDVENYESFMLDLEDILVFSERELDLPEK